MGGNRPHAAARRRGRIRRVAVAVAASAAMLGAATVPVAASAAPALTNAETGLAHDVVVQTKPIDAALIAERVRSGKGRLSTFLPLNDPDFGFNRTSAMRSGGLLFDNYDVVLSVDEPGGASLEPSLVDAINAVNNAQETARYHYAGRMTGVPTSPYDLPDGVIVVHSRSTADCGGGAIGCTITLFGTLQTGPTVLVNAAVNVWPGAPNQRGIVLHEFAHAAGLGHFSGSWQSDTYELMNPYNVGLSEYQHGDLNGLKTLGNVWPGDCRALEACYVRFGSPGDVAVPADYNGDGVADLGIYRDGTWYIDTNRDGNADLSVRFGGPGDRAYGADYNGDGVADLIIFRGAVGTWFIDTNRDGNADVVIHYASPGDKPYIGDFNHDGRIDLGIFRESEGNWYVDTNGDGIGDIVEHYASPGDVPAPADYNHDGTLDYAIFRPSNGCYFINDAHFHQGASPAPWGGTLPNGFATTEIGFASPGDQMAAADFRGDGTTQLAIFRASTGKWYMRNAAWNTPRGDEGRACH